MWHTKTMGHHIYNRMCTHAHTHKHTNTQLGNNSMHSFLICVWWMSTAPDDGGDNMDGIFTIKCDVMSLPPPSSCWSPALGQLGSTRRVQQLDLGCGGGDRSRWHSSLWFLVLAWLPILDLFPLLWGSDVAAVNEQLGQWSSQKNLQPLLQCRWVYICHR